MGELVALLAAAVPESGADFTAGFDLGMLVAAVAKFDAQARESAQRIEQFPGEANQANFLLGSAHGFLAESGSDSAEQWSKSARYFAKCDPLTLPDIADRGRCVFRSAKATAAIGAGNPIALLPALQAVPSGEDVGERSRLIAETSLRLNPPDWKRAKEELSAFLSGPQRGTPAGTAKYRLKLSELCLQTNEPEKARAWLQQIDKNATPEVQALAKVQLARLAAADNNWQEAVGLFAAAQATPGLPNDQLGMIRYETGKGYLALNNKVEAAAFFERAAADGGAASLASNVKLAELAARDPMAKGKRAAAAEQLEAAVKTLKPGVEFRNAHVSLDDVRNAFEETIQVCLAEGDYATALRSIAAYGSVSLPGRDRERKAESYSAWAASLAGQSTPDATLLAKEKWKLAADEYTALATAHLEDDVLLVVGIGGQEQQLDLAFEPQTLGLELGELHLHHLEFEDFLHLARDRQHDEIGRSDAVHRRHECDGDAAAELAGVR